MGRKQMKQPRVVAVAIVILFSASVVGLASACGQAPSDHVTRQVDRLLARYDLHAAGAPSTSQQLLGEDAESFGSQAQASRSIGLDLRAHAGEQVEEVTYRLRENSQSGEGITATFVVSGGTVVGAYLNLIGYAGGFTPLNSHREFAVPIAPDNLNFSGVSSVELLGPWGAHGWTHHVTLSGAESQRLETLVQASRLHSGERYGTVDDREYALTFTYGSGQVLGANLFTKNDSGATYLTFDPHQFSGWYFTPPTELEQYVEAVLAAEGD